MQERFHLHFTFLYTLVRFFAFLEHLKEAMKLFKTISSTTLPMTWEICPEMHANEIHELYVP